VQDVSEIHAGGLLSDGQNRYSGNVGSAALGSSRNYSAHQPSITAGGGKFLVAYSYEEPPNGSVNIFATQFDENESQPTPFRVSGAAADQTDPTVAFNGVFMVVWRDRRNGSDDLWGARISTGGAVQDPDGFLVTEFYPENGFAAITKATSATQTFTITWEAIPAGQDSGIVAFGIGPAPK
jgi:hypothetical protein